MLTGSWEAIQRAGGQAWSEPRQDFWQDRRRTDIFAVLGPKSYHVDVRVTHPTSTSYVELACQGPLRAADAAAQEKKRRYAAMASAEGAEFVPFVVETYGGFGTDARAFMDDLARVCLSDVSSLECLRNKALVASGGPPCAL